MRILIKSLVMSALVLVTFKSYASECRFESYKRFKNVEKTDHIVVKRKPDAELEFIINRYELTCPFQVENDFNKDSRPDWAGIVKNGNEYNYLAYISGQKRYQIKTLKTLPFFPEGVHFSLKDSKNIAKVIGNNDITKTSETVLEINHIGKPTLVYGWNGKDFVHLVSYEGSFEDGDKQVANAKKAFKVKEPKALTYKFEKDE